MISSQKKNEFLELFGECAGGYLSGPDGKSHLSRHEAVRMCGRANFDKIQIAAERGEDTTDAVLRLLLPYTDSAAHQTSGAWIHIAPAIQGDVREWFQKAGWTRSEDWPKVAQAIFFFVSRSTKDFAALEAACREFNNLSYTTGFQTGLLTPILNALRPDDFMLINNKSRSVINYFTDSTFKQRLIDYPAANAAARALVAEVAVSMREVSGNEARSTDLFDAFCHWLVAIRKYPPVSGQSHQGRIRAANREVIVSVPENEDTQATVSVDDFDVTSTEPRESHRVQATLAKIGAEMGFRIWIPRSDRQKVVDHAGASLRSALLDVLPLNYDDATLKTIEQIDILWLKNRSMARAFEVEHTTAIYSGLLRMADLLALQPNMDIRLHIVAPDEKREKVLREIKRPVFSLLDGAPLYERCSFIPYSAIDKLRSLPHLAHMSDSILKEYEEFSEEE